MNCLVIEDNESSRILIEEFIKKTEGLKLIKSFSTAVNAINLINKTANIHLIFLDIEMPDMTGLEFLNSLKT